MLELQFETFLASQSSITSKDKAVNSRMSKARAVERQLQVSLDYIVANDQRMFEALQKLNNEMNNKNGAYSNALRKYYLFKNNKEFPRIKDY